MPRKIKKTTVDTVNTYNEYFLRFCEMCVNRFNWKNLPDTVNERYLELTLLFNGSACYFNDDVMGNLALKCTIAGNIDVYGDPTAVEVFGQNGYTNRITDKNNFVVIYANKMRNTNLLNQLLEYSARLTRIDRTIDVNINAQKTPVLLTGDDKQILGLKNLYAQYSGDAPVIYGDKFQLTRDSIQAIRTDAPYVSGNLYDLKIQYWNEVLTLLGLSNIGINKKERLIQDEVQRSLGGVFINRAVALNSRQEAIDEINKKFGTNISIEFIDDTMTQDLETSETTEGGDVENE